MPDHVHLVYTPLQNEQGLVYMLSEVLNGIKGASAHSINKALCRQGRVWQDESFDHVIRGNESARSKVEYICENPVRQGLVKSPGDYRWLWREWEEGIVVPGESEKEKGI